MNTPHEDVLSLEAQTRDYVASVARSLVGAVPIAGSLLVELADAIIPHQRLERVAKFAEYLEVRFSTLEQKFVRSQLANENFTDLLEESLRQAARSLSDERRQYIAALVANGLTTDQITYVESKHLLRTLGEINDIEIIRLASEQYRTQGRGAAFFERHKNILTPVFPSYGSAQPEIDKATLQSSYDAHLQQLGLLTPRYNVDRKTGQFQVGVSGDLEISGHSLSSFGRLLLRQIDLLDPENTE